MRKTVPVIKDFKDFDFILYLCGSNERALLAYYIKKSKEEGLFINDLPLIEDKITLISLHPLDDVKLEIRKLEVLMEPAEVESDAGRLRISAFTMVDKDGNVRIIINKNGNLLVSDPIPDEYVKLFSLS